MRQGRRFNDIKVSVFDSGTCGEHLNWVLKDNVLEIFGKGEMTDFVSPWYAYRSLIEYVCIEQGVNTIGQYAFYNCDNLKNINIPSSIYRIGDYAFYSCTALRNISIDKNVVEIGTSAFMDCHDLTILCKNRASADICLSDKRFTMICV